MRRSSLVVLAGITALALLVAACGGAPAPSATATATGPVGPGTAVRGGGTVTVAAAASLRGPFAVLAGDLRARPGGPAATFTFDSSATLARQVVDGAPADVFAAADEASMATVADAGLVVGTPRVFARNVLTVVVKPGNPLGIRSLADLPRAGTVALCGREVPCGRYAEQALASAGVALPAERVSRGQNATATLQAVAEGDADAGLVYATDARDARVAAVPLAAGQSPVAAYAIAVLTTAADPAAARAFVDLVLSPAGQDRLAAAGFLPP